MGGFGGGGFSGDFSQREEGVYPQRNGNSAPDYSWQSKSMILTQGDKVEWKVSGKKGQTVFAFVVSDVFDPALSIVDDQNKELISNDDQMEGDQSPFITFNFPDDREYKITVKNYRSTAGGKFNLFSRFFVPIDLKMGSNKVTPNTKAIVPEAYETAFRIKAEKGTIYALEAPTLNESGYKNQLNGVLRIIGPSGVPSQDYKGYRHFGGNQVFEAKASGDYYVCYQRAGNQNRDDQSRFYEARLSSSNIVKGSKTSSESISVSPHEFQILVFPVDHGDVIRTIYSGEITLSNKISAPKATDVYASTESDQRLLAELGFIWYWPLMSNENDFIRYYGGSGDVEIVFYNPTDKSAQMKVENSMAFSELQGGKSYSESVALGQTYTYLLKAKRGDNYKLTATANGIEPVIEILDQKGKRTTFIDRKKHSLTAKLLIPEGENTYLVTVAAAGGGGTGNFKLNVSKATPKVYTLGTTGIPDDSDEVMNNFVVKLEPGQTYQVVLENDIQGIGFEDGDGATLSATSVNRFDKTQVYYLKPKVGGDCIFRLYGPSKQAKFKIAKYTIPKADGN